jgi:hypothetical protein
MISQAIAAAKNQVKQAVTQLALGNFARGVQGVADLPGSVVKNFRASGGVDYGDAFAGINARGDALQNWCWYAVMPEVTNRSAFSFGGNQPSVALPWYYVQTANMPRRNVASDSTMTNGHQRYYPGSYQVDELQLGFFMDTKNVAQQYLSAWESLILNTDDPADTLNQGMWGLPAEYKKDINILLLDTVKREMLNVKYVRCWPTNLEALDLTSESAAALVQNVRFVVEDVYVSVSNDKGLIDNLTETALGYGMGAIQGPLTAQLNKLDIGSFF